MSKRPMLRRWLALALTALPSLVACAADTPPATAPVAGVDYEVIADGKPYAPLNGKVEVAEVFSYACVHCAHFEPKLQAWKKRQPAHVRLTPVPAALSSAWIPYARAYYAAEMSGMLAQSHGAVFKALHETGSLPMRNVSVDELSAFYAGLGADRARFAALLRSPEVDAKVEHARAFAVASQVGGTPTLVVNGKYRVTGGSNYDDVLRITDWLVARERGAGK